MAHRTRPHHPCQKTVVPYSKLHDITALRLTEGSAELRARRNRVGFRPGHGAKGEQ